MFDCNGHDLNRRQWPNEHLNHLPLGAIVSKTLDSASHRPIMATQATIINRIRADLASIDDLAPPASSTASKNVSVTLADYAKGRDEYINSKALLCFLDGVKENKAPEYDPASLEQINQQKQDFLQQFNEASESLSKSLVEREAKYAGLLQQRADLEAIMLDMSVRRDLDNVTEQDEVPIVDEADMEQEQRRLDELQLKATELRAKLHEKQQKHDKIRKRIPEMQKALREKHPDLRLDDTAQLAELQKQNEAILEPYKKAKENCGLVRSIFEVHQAILGITLLNVTAAPEHIDADIILTLRLLKQHDIQVGFIRVQNTVLASASGKMRPVFATFLTDTVVRGPRLQFHHGNPVFEKEIPALDDLVRLSQSIVDPIAAFHFLLSETMARISTTQALVTEMSVLEEELAKDGETSDYKFYTFGSQFGDTEHNVTFEFNGMVILLRLTTDCPKTLGSVFVEEIVAKETSGWNQTDIDDAMKRVNTMQFKSPVEIVRAIKSEVSKLTKRSDGMTAAPVEADSQAGEQEFRQKEVDSDEMDMD